MRFIALILGFAALAMALDPDTLCHFHTTEKDCAAWTIAKSPTDDGAGLNVTQQSKPVSSNSKVWKPKAISPCVKIPLDPGAQVRSLAMDTNYCTKGPKSTDEAELAQFNVVVFFSDASCSLEASNVVHPLAEKNDPKKWVNKCWKIYEAPGWGCKSVALALVDPSTL